MKTDYSKPLGRILTLVRKTEEAYKRDKANDDIRNMSYYRGKFWNGDGVSASDKTIRDYSSAQNEIFPILDSLASQLAQDVPACELIDGRARMYSSPGRVEDPTLQGRSLAAVLNMWSEDNRLHRLMRAFVLHAGVFRFAISKTVWDPAKNRPSTTSRLPWEVHFDPTAKDIEGISWAFERFVLHISELEGRIASGAYEKPERKIEGTGYPRSLLEDEVTDEQAAHLREAGINEYVSLVEFWDFLDGHVYHIDCETKQVLLKMKIQWGNPYTVFIFHDAIGRIEGIPDVTLMADKQRDINELISARREVVRRLARKVLVARDLFQDEDEWNRYISNKTYQPVRVHLPMGRSIQESIYVTPEVPTTYDFNAALEQDKEAIRRTAGVADFERGVARNIRTAAEVDLLGGNVTGRGASRQMLVVDAVLAIFKLHMECWKWALRNKKASGIDMETICAHTQVDIAPDVLERMALESSPRYRILPFSPLMEDRNARRQNLVQLTQTLLGSPMAEHMNLREYAREVVDQFGLRPSIIKSAKDVAAEAEAAQAAMAAQATAQSMPTSEEGGMLQPDAAMPME